jgi:hypothetical protein
VKSTWWRIARRGYFSLDRGGSLWRWRGWRWMVVVTITCTYRKMNQNQQRKVTEKPISIWGNFPNISSPQKAVNSLQINMWVKDLKQLTKYRMN